MEEKGFSHLPPVEPLLASHLHPTQKSTMILAGPFLPSKAMCFQSSLTEKGYKAVAMSLTALNTLSLLLTRLNYMSISPTPALWDKVCMVMNLCLRCPGLQKSHDPDDRSGESKMAEPIQSFPEGDDSAPQRPCGPERLVQPSSSHHAEVL
eukprot:superscaffoldBa00002795_g15312